MTARRLAALTVAGLVVGMLSMTAGVTVPAVAGMASRAASAQNAFNAEAVQNAQGARASQDVQVVTLITGDRVAISTTPDRKPQVNVMPAVKGTSFQVMTLGTQVYVIPQTAAGYLGTPLDPSLFDVTRLAAGGYANTAKPLKLSITYARGASARALPGMTSAGGGTVSRAGALRFGAALAAESGSTAHGKLFAGIARIAVAGLAAPTKITGRLAAAPSTAAPGSVYALAGNASAQHYASGLYQNSGHLFDVTSGTNGDNCSGTYLCAAVPGYDGPTGLGTPDGTGSF